MLLSDKRDTLKLCLLFNILTDRVTYPSCPIMLKHTPYANRHTNTVQLLVPQARTNQFKYSFIPSMTERWNGLHFDTNGITSLNMLYNITNYTQSFICCLCSVYGFKIYISYLFMATFLYDQCSAQICLHKKIKKYSVKELRHLENAHN